MSYNQSLNLNGIEAEVADQGGIGQDSSALQALLYREIGLQAVAAELNLTLDEDMALAPFSGQIKAMLSGNIPRNRMVISETRGRSKKLDRALAA